MTDKASLTFTIKAKYMDFEIRLKLLLDQLLARWFLAFSKDGEVFLDSFSGGM